VQRTTRVRHCARHDTYLIAASTRLRRRCLACAPSSGFLTQKFKVSGQRAVAKLKHIKLARARYLSLCTLISQVPPN